MILSKGTQGDYRRSLAAIFQKIPLFSGEPRKTYFSPPPTTMMANGCLRGLSNGRQHLLNAARGLLREECHDSSNTKRRILRCFPLTEKNVCTPALTTPDDFHTTLCHLITSAKHRVYLASLYIGPAANPSSSQKELELLMALQSTAAPQVKILLDKNRALRPVPIIKDEDPHRNLEKTENSISSAEACFRVVENKISQLRHDPTTPTSNENSGVFLFSVLPLWQQFVLPNPYNEVAGVFHLKCYIIDDDIILTGANLSEEYFCDRIDRYLWLTAANHCTVNSNSNNADSQHSRNNNLVEFYIQLIDNLCQHAEPYTSKSSDKLLCYPQRTTKKELLYNLVNLLTIEQSTGANETGTDCTLQNETPLAIDDEHIIAYAVPTFQAPSGFFPGLHKTLPSDTTVFTNLIEAISDSSFDHSKSFQMRLASAYLNLTDHMIKALGACHGLGIHLLTAGYISHGFKPNTKKIGNKGKSWIPAVFNILGRQCVDALRQTQLVSFGIGSDHFTKMWYFQREGWTFHAKGIWFTENETIFSNKVHDTTASMAEIVDATSLCAAIHGSGNYGERSAGCDMESNLILIFADSSNTHPNKLQTMFQAEWNSMCQYAQSAENEKVQPLSFHLRIVLPMIRPFF
jgi:CDP-diacylglycerol---glycerol-3-phosphate 3-phosphatidyltransferase